MDNFESSFPVTDNIAHGFSVRDNYAALQRRQTRIVSSATEPISMGKGKLLPPQIEDAALYEVAFDENDPQNPQNWPAWLKMGQLLVSAAATFSVTITSALIGGALELLTSIYDIRISTSGLTVGLYVVGYGTGPILWGPVSDVYGRRAPMIIAHIMFVCFVFAVATSENVQTLMICRFFAGVAGAAPLVIYPDIINDMFPLRTRGLGLIIYCICCIGVPMLGPMIGKYIVHSYLSWRWTQYVGGISGSLSLLILYLFQKETHHPVILTKKATQLRAITGIWAIHAFHDHIKLNALEITRMKIIEPLKILVLDPLLAIISFYAGVWYGLMFFMLQIGPLLFEHYGWFEPNTGLPLLAVFFGTCLGGLIQVIVFEPHFRQRLEASKCDVLPEGRLPPLVFSALVGSCGLFLAFWTAHYQKFWLVPCIGLVLIGVGIFGVFEGTLTYLFDSHIESSGMAMSGNTFMRSAIGCSFPVFAQPLLRAWKIRMTGTFMGAIGFGGVIVPLALMIIGPKFRQYTHFRYRNEKTQKTDLGDFESNLGSDQFVDVK